MDGFYYTHRSADRNIFPNLWSFFGGGIQKGEDPVVALKRETERDWGTLSKIRDSLFPLCLTTDRSKLVCVFSLRNIEARFCTFAKVRIGASSTTEEMKASECLTMTATWLPMRKNGFGD